MDIMHSRHAAFLAALVLAIAACATPGATTRPSVVASRAPTTGPISSPTSVATMAPTTAPTATTAANIPPVVCVGEATTYLDYLNGDLEPEPADPIPSP